MKAALTLARTLLLVLVAATVVLNFARPAPISVADQYQPALGGEIEAADSVAAAVLVEPAGPAGSDSGSSSPAPGETKRSCPCPTEIENMDCDEGICSVAAIFQKQPGQIQPPSRSRHAWFRGRGATPGPGPDPHPPRLLI